MIFSLFLVNFKRSALSVSSVPLWGEVGHVCQAFGEKIAFGAGKSLRFHKKNVPLHPQKRNTVEKFGCLQPLEKMLKLR
ncbi:hypothetical protein [Sodaliphilus sp.]|uniref:hypothetical protein n=1 Tax=Sodaliphilus sp. TaxID=2815818 RepID=UPI00388F5293